MKGILKTLIERIVDKSEVRVDRDLMSHHVHIDDKMALKLALYEEISTNFAKEVSELETLAAQKRAWETEFAVKQAEQEKREKLHEIEFATKRDTLEAAIRMETDEDKRKMMQTGVENIALQEKVKYLEGELKFYRDMAKDSTSAVNETLKTAFQNKPMVTINNS